MKKFLFIFIFIIVLLINTAECAGIIETGSDYIITDAVSLKPTLISQDPYPAEPDGYVDLLFKVENWGTKKAENVIFKLLPNYPFSLDTGMSADKELGTINGLQTNENAILIKYRVRIDKNAVDGENGINIKYAYGTGVVYYTKTFNVTISNPRTDFDVSVQELSKTIISLVIDNIGKNSAQSVIVKLPEQEGFEILGSSTYSIGEMKSGNHTTVSFPITPLKTQENLTVEIYYTDKIGVRRTVQKKLLITKSFIEDFDLIVQDSTSTSVTLAIANIGTDTAYSVIMKIPEQENFRVTGTSTSILGNLDAGDYTLASFQITSIKSAVNISAGLGGVPSTRNVTNISADREKNLIVEISYTDTLGIRRTVQKKVELNMVSITGEVTGTETRTWSTQRNQSQMSAGNGLIYIGVGVVGIIIIVVFLRFRKRKKK